MVESTPSVTRKQHMFFLTGSIRNSGVYSVIMVLVYAESAHYQIRDSACTSFSSCLLLFKASLPSLLRWLNTYSTVQGAQCTAYGLGTPTLSGPAKPQAPTENNDPETLPLRPEVNQVGTPKLSGPAEPQAPPVPRDPTLPSRSEVNRMDIPKLSGPAEPHVPPIHLSPGTLRFRPEVDQMGTPMLFKSADVQLRAYRPLNTRQWMPGPSGDDWDQWDEWDKPVEPDTHERTFMNPVMFWLLALMNCVFTLRGVLSFLHRAVAKLRRRERQEWKGELASGHMDKTRTDRQTALGIRCSLLQVATQPTSDYVN